MGGAAPHWPATFFAPARRQRGTPGGGPPRVEDKGSPGVEDRGGPPTEGAGVAGRGS
jgi:hypothetical protein